MYAHRRVYVKQWEHQKPEERYTVDIARGGKPVAGIKPERISSLEEEVMVWRGASHIHRWFVTNVQEGKDDCGKYLVDVDWLRQLLEDCEKVIEASTLIDGLVLVSLRRNPNTGAWEERREPGKVIGYAEAARMLLPTNASGPLASKFEYDEHYLEQVIRTRDWAERMLEDQKKGVPGDIYYSSSW